jgi:glycosyltransferase involved in cell wall biosynthesis
MKISGFSFVRNAVKYGYPVVESLRSLVPLCDEVVLVVGASDDGTLELVRSLNEPSLRIIETVWDETLRSGGRIFAQQTDIAYAHCTGDWCLYLQADEVLHEADTELIQQEMNAANNANNDERCEALIFRYLHFYGSYDYVGSGRQWYRREIRALRRQPTVISWRDAQGFRKTDEAGNAVKLRAKQTDARIFHYGWVREPQAQERKLKNSNRLYDPNAPLIHDNASENGVNGFDYTSAYELERFAGSHPAVMAERIERDRLWTSRFDASRLKPKPLLVKLTDGIEHRTGWRIGEYRNFIEVK